MRFIAGTTSTIVCAAALCALAGCGGDKGTEPRPNPSAWQYRWASGFGDAGSQFARSVAVDGARNVIVAGHFNGTVNFGGDDLVCAGGRDVFVAKFDSSGTHLWSKRFGGGSEETVQGVAVDYAGNVYLAGYTEGSIDFGGGPLTTAGGRDVFLAKLDRNGGYLRAALFGDASHQQANALALDSNGNPVIVGMFSSSVTFGVDPLTSAGGWDVFVAKFDSDGNHVWSKGFGNGVSQYATAVGIDRSGGVIVAGYFEGSIDFGGGALTSAGGEDIYVAKFDKDGNHLWSKRFGDGSTQQQAWGVAVDASENVIVTGSFTGTVGFGGGSFAANGNGDIFVAKFDGSGNHLWSKEFGDDAGQAAWGVAVDAAGNVLLAGAFNGTVNFGGGTLATSTVNDVFLAKLGPDGAHIWSSRFGDAAAYQTAQAVAVDAAGNAIIAGFFEGGIDFGGGLLTSAGAEDIFVAKFGR